MVCTGDKVFPSVWQLLTRGLRNPIVVKDLFRDIARGRCDVYATFAETHDGDIAIAAATVRTVDLGKDSYVLIRNLVATSDEVSYTSHL